MKFIPDYFKTHYICESGKKLLFAIIDVPDQCKIEQMHEKVILENPRMLECIANHYKNQEICESFILKDCFY